MTVQAAIAFAAFLLEDDHFFTFNEGKENFGLHLSTFNGRNSDFNVAVGIEKKHFVEDHFLAFLYFVAEMMNIQELALFGLELLSFDFNDSVHCFLDVDFISVTVGRE